MLAFPEAKQVFYTASAYLGMTGRTAAAGEWARRAESSACVSIGLYETPPAAEQRLGELSLARLDLAAARIERADLDGAAEPIRIVIDTVSRRPTDSVTRRLRQLAEIADRPAHRDAPAARRLREEILDVCAGAGSPAAGLRGAGEGGVGAG
jgi:hypothetical protein